MYGKDKPHGKFKASYKSVLNQWKTLETTLATESNDLPAKLALPYHPTSCFFTSCFFTIGSI